MRGIVDTWLPSKSRADFINLHFFLHNLIDPRYGGSTPLSRFLGLPKDPRLS
jgi:hypothetical protein